MGDFASNDYYEETWQDKVWSKIGGCLVVAIGVAIACSLPRIVAWVEPGLRQAWAKIAEVAQWLGWLGY